MFRRPALIALCAFSLSACASKPQTGIMAADWTPPAKSDIPAQRVTIAWESDSRTTGQMTFTLGRGGQRYVGSYLLLENTESHLEAQPLYDIWDNNGFDAITYTGAPIPWFQPAWGLNTFVKHYNGRVVVGLHGNRGGNARCKFTLADTEAGMPGGGTGECQVDDGSHLSVRF